MNNWHCFITQGTTLKEKKPRMMDLNWCSRIPYMSSYTFGYIHDRAVLCFVFSNEVFNKIKNYLLIPPSYFPENSKSKDHRGHSEIMVDASLQIETAAAQDVLSFAWKNALRP